MTSEHPHPPLRMPDHLFSQLAVGAGSPEALAFLERSERARRLLLLRTALARTEALPSPLGPPAGAWRVLKAAARQAPDVVEDLLLAPHTGAWLAHLLRRVHHTAPGPPLWAETGQLHVLAVTAALRADVEADLQVPLTNGTLALPGLGLVRLPGHRPTLSVGHATTKAGELTLSSSEDDTPFVCRPRTVAAADAHRQAGDDTAGGGDGTTDAGERTTETGGQSTEAGGQSTEAGEGSWAPLRTLTHTGPAGPTTILLDDLGPYRDLDEPIPPERLDADEAKAWQDLLGEAVAFLGAARDPGPGRMDAAHIRVIVPWGRTRATPPPPQRVELSASSGDAYGSMVITRPASALSLAETFVHEFQHSKLAALIHLFPLLDDDREERYYAPWRCDPRHLTGLLHGAYAFTAVAGFWRDRMTERRHADLASYHFALRRMQTRLVVRTLLTSGRLTAAGRHLVDGLAGTLDAWLREPVAPEPLARARAAAALHRTEWRLRNVVPSKGPSDERAASPQSPQLRSDRRLWPDLRTQALALAPTAPHTADEHLAAGDAASALSRYADALAEHPDDPHLLSGWIVARAFHTPGPAARHMLARPELMQPPGVSR